MSNSFFLPEQPTQFGRSHYFTITHGVLEVQLDFEHESIAGKVQYHIEAKSCVSLIELDAAEMKIESVLSDVGIVSYEHSQDKLKIELGKELRPDERCTITIRYFCKPTRGLYFRCKSSEFPNRITHAFTHSQPEDSRFWYPCYNYPNILAKFDTYVAAPENMTVIGNGRLESVNQTKQGMKTWHFIGETPHCSYLVSIVAGDFEKKMEMRNKVSIEYYFPKVIEDNLERSFGKMQQMFDCLEELTGLAYPYSKYAQSIVSDFYHGGMENISATTLSESILHDERAHLDISTDDLISHELAHQWFGDLITVKDWSHVWLNEGLASYCHAAFLKEDEGPDYFDYYMRTKIAVELSEDFERYQRPLVTKQFWDPEEMFDYHSYYKAAWVLNTLCGLLGQKVFNKGIHEYVKSFKGCLVETSDFRKVMENVSGQSLESFFEDWFYSPGFPEYDAKFEWNEQSKAINLEITQTNALENGTPLFTNPIQIEFDLAEGRTQILKISLQNKRELFTFSLPERPLNIIIDPENRILMKLKTRKPKEMSFYQLKNGINAMQRIRACEELSGFQTNDAVHALSDKIREDEEFWGVRLEAARALGKIGTREALNVLLEQINHKDHRSRRGIAFGLRGFSRLDREYQNMAISALIHILTSDISYFARGAAAESLGYYRESNEALEAMNEALSQESAIDVVRSSIFTGFIERGDKTVISLCANYLKSGKMYQGRISAAQTLGKLGKGSRQATEALLSSQSIRDPRIRSQAVTAIQNLGDSGVLVELEKWLTSESDGSCRRRLREAIAALKSTATPLQDLKTIERIEESVSELKRRLMEISSN